MNYDLLILKLIDNVKVDGDTFSLLRIGRNKVIEEQKVITGNEYVLLFYYSNHFIILYIHLFVFYFMLRLVNPIKKNIILVEKEWLSSTNSIE